MVFLSNATFLVQSLKSRGIRFLGRDDESLAPIFTPPHSTTTPEAAGVCESGMGGLGDMKLIFGTTVVRKRGKAGKEDKIVVSLLFDTLNSGLAQGYFLD
ncbi:hypothetical protein JHK87_027736 [Glycine soja]|nr:hypothetical protein JHK87_027736 [Glycine soja]